MVSFFTSFGTILFAFGGASCFPNLQVDMKQPDKFPLAVVIGILGRFFCGTYHLDLLVD